MKKFVYTLSLALLLAMSALGFAGCTSGATVTPTKLVGVWEVVDEGGYTYITRIEFKDPLEEGANGTFSYYTENGSTAYNGTWAPRAESNCFNIMFESGFVGVHKATLAEGRLFIEFNIESNEVTNTYNKISD